MRFAKTLLPAAILAFACTASAAAEPPDTTTSYKAPIVASLSSDAREQARNETTPRLAPRSRQSGSAVLSSPGGQLAATVAVFVFATFLASVASRRS